MTTKGNHKTLPVATPLTQSLHTMQLHLRLTTAAAAAFLFLAAPANAMLAATEAGEVRGMVKPNAGAQAEVFLGVPYAAPPVGSLRWAAPTPPLAWQGERDGSVAPPVCPQGTTGSEDCLYVNIYRPVGTMPGASLPVMVYAYGGGNVGGSANAIDATRLAADNGIIVVVPNHRLGALGFLNHLALAPVDQGGNYGVLDIKASLQWVKRNIGAFGGNANNVTLGSQSSGSTNVCRLLVDKSAAGLFQAAILSSEDCIHDVDPPEDAVVRASNLANAVGCTNPATVASCLRSKTPAEILAGGGRGPQGSGWNPTAAKSAAASIAAGDWNRVPVMLGSTREEGRSAGTAFTKFTAQDYAAWVARLVGPARAPAVLAAYPTTKYAGPYAIPYVIGDIVTDSGMRGLGGCPNAWLAKSISSQAPLYYYQFEDPRPPSGSSPAGYDVLASHGSDIPYLFPRDTSSDASTRFTPEQRRLSDEMIRYWGAFTKNRDPSIAGQQAWPRLTAESGQMLALRPAAASQATKLSQFEQQHNCALWSTIPVILDRGEL